MRIPLLDAPLQHFRLWIISASYAPCLCPVRTFRANMVSRSNMSFSRCIPSKFCVSISLLDVHLCAYVRRFRHPLTVSNAAELLEEVNEDVFPQEWSSQERFDSLMEMKDWFDIVYVVQNL